MGRSNTVAAVSRRAAFAACVGVALVGTVAATLSSPTAHAQDGDETVARALFKSGKAALSKRKFGEAITLFDKALKEHSALIEAAYWKAVALDKRGDRADALDALRKYADLFEKKDGRGDATKGERALEAKAQKRIGELAAGERELAKLNDAFASKLMTLARKHEKNDPDVALGAARAVLAVRPDHPGASKLHAALGGNTPAPAAGGGAAPKSVSLFSHLKLKKHHDLLAKKSFSEKAHLKYRDGHIQLDLTGGKMMTPGEHVDVGAGRFVYETSFRCRKEHDRGWLAGIVFGVSGGRMYSAFAQKSSVVLHYAEGSSRIDLESHAMRPIALDQWVRLGVKVDGRRIEVWFDGEKVLSHELEEGQDAKGDVGLFQQRCKIEYRALQAAQLE